VRVIDRPLEISQSQLDQIESMIATMRDPETCRFSTAGAPRPLSDAVNVNRPVQRHYSDHDLKYCNGGDFSKSQLLANLRLTEHAVKPLSDSCRHFHGIMQSDAIPHFPPSSKFVRWAVLHIGHKEFFDTPRGNTCWCLLDGTCPLGCDIDSAGNCEGPNCDSHWDPSAPIWVLEDRSN
jgi:hypothetical protein